MARPKGVIQKRDEKKYWLPDGITLKIGQPDNYNKETKLVFIDNTHGEFLSTYKSIQDANNSLHPKAMSIRKSLNNPGASKESRTRAKETNLKKYGVEYVSQLPEVKLRIRETFNKNNNITDVLNKMGDTCLIKYGHTNPMQSSEIKDRFKKTMIERYGVDNPNDLQHVKELKIQKMIDKNCSSKEENELRDYISSLGLKAEKSYIGGSNPKELDIKVKEKNLAFEMNGLYWHNEKMGKDRHYHLNKTNSCKDNGIRLIHIFDKEWHDKKLQLKGYIKSALNMNEIIIYARKCILKEVNSQESREFLDKYHILGQTSIKGGIGLYYDNKLISLITYNTHHRNNNELLLNRYCTKTNITVIGGLSRLSKHLFNKIGKFYTFIDLRFSDGKSWLKCGYTEIHTSSPDYFYYNSREHCIVKKQARKKSTVKTPENMTEYEHAEIDGLVRVWDCGKIKMIYNIE